MPMITFHCDREIPGTSNVPILAALGVASQGFRVSYVRADPLGIPVTDMMPEFLEGVDVVRGCLTASGDSTPSTSGEPSDTKDVRSPPPSGRDFMILDVPMPNCGSRGGFEGDSVVCFVTRPPRLARRPVTAGARPLYCGCDGVSRGEISHEWDESLNGRKLLLPAFTPAETGSLLRGFPLVRARAAARELGVELLERAAVDGCARGFAWPSSSRRSFDRRERACPTAVPSR